MNREKVKVRASDVRPVKDFSRQTTFMISSREKSFHRSIDPGKHSSTNVDVYDLTEKLLSSNEKKPQHNVDTILPFIHILFYIRLLLKLF